jgi:hypothetical protein
MITRQVQRGHKPWSQCRQGWEPEEVIWPTWPGQLPDEAAASSSAPLAGVQDCWDKAGSRLRDSAKWIAAVLGAGWPVGPGAIRAPSDPWAVGACSGHARKVLQKTPAYGQGTRS